MAWAARQVWRGHQRRHGLWLGSLSGRRQEIEEGTDMWAQNVNETRCGGQAVSEPRERGTSACAASAWARALQAHVGEENGPALLRLGRSQERGESGWSWAARAGFKGEKEKSFFFFKLVFQTKF